MPRARPLSALARGIWAERWHGPAMVIGHEQQLMAGAPQWHSQALDAARSRNNTRQTGRLERHLRRGRGQRNS
eukprot:11164885-Lingulodinium_polyedra.AAC.1